MTNEEKIEKIQFALDHPGRITQYYNLLKDMGDMKYNYQEYLTGSSCDKELERLPEADYELATALLTLVLREDHFCEGSFKKRYDAGQVDAILNRMIETLV